MDRPTALNLYHLGEVYFDQGLDSDALKMVNDALKADPNLGPAKLLRNRITGAAHSGQSLGPGARFA